MVVVFAFMVVASDICDFSILPAAMTMSNYSPRSLQNHCSTPTPLKRLPPIPYNATKYPIHTLLKRNANGRIKIKLNIIILHEIPFSVRHYAMHNLLSTCFSHMLCQTIKYRISSVPSVVGWLVRHRISR